MTTPDQPQWKLELRAMIGRGWLFSVISRDGTWKVDPDLPGWMTRGWVEHTPGVGFRITPEGEEAALR